MSALGLELGGMRTHQWLDHWVPNCTDRCAVSWFGCFARRARWIAPLIARFANGAARLSCRIRKREDA